ncbi:hypothetical protein CSA17_06605, partial [bacterium DOLJORAL78_65_58]
AVFIFFFSLFYKQSQAIMLFFALTGAIFAGWSGAVIIGGLYTRWGTALAAWATTISGVALALTGFVLEQAQRSWRETGVAFWGLLDGFGLETARGWAAWTEVHLPNGQEIWGWTMWICGLIYVVVSLLQQRFLRPKRFNLDKLLHRGPWAMAGEDEQGAGPVHRGWQALGITGEFGRRDKGLYVVTWAWHLAWLVVFLVGTVFFLTRHVPDGDWSRWDGVWLRFWHTRIWIEMLISIVVIVWFTWGGIRDVKRLLTALSSREVDESDDGIVTTKRDG